jgi:hypothetical protein
MPNGGRIQSLIDQLVRDAGPVRRLWSPGTRLASWLAGLGALATALAVAGLRPDLGARLAGPGYLAELVSLVVATIAAGWVALRGAVPGLDAGGGRRTLAATIVAAGALGLAGTSLSPATSLSDFVQTGLPCFLKSIALALAPGAVMFWAIWRGAPLRPTVTSAVGGLAAALGAYLLMRLSCPLEETGHLAVWHGGPVLLATIAGALAGIALAGRYRRARPVV